MCGWGSRFPIQTFPIQILILTISQTNVLGSLWLSWLSIGLPSVGEVVSSTLCIPMHRVLEENNV